MRLSMNIKNKQLVVLILSIFLMFSIIDLYAQNVKIGILAKRGAAKTIKKWKATADYLTQKIPGKTFKIIPLDFPKILPAAKSRSVDFILANSSIYVEMEKGYGAKAIATMINSRQGKPLRQFGGVIFTKAGNSAINTLTDLKGKKFMAVKENSFGGWRMAYRLLKENNINPFKDFSKMVFGGTHDNVVLAVKNGVMDAGTVRTDTYERMAAEGKIKLEDFKIINNVSHAGFPFKCSTKLYPEWPMAQVKGTPDALAKEVADALTAMKADSKAAKSANVVGWTASLDYTPVDECLKVLKVGPYKK